MAILAHILRRIGWNANGVAPQDDEENKAYIERKRDESSANDDGDEGWGALTTNNDADDDDNDNRNSRSKDRQW